MAIRIALTAVSQRIMAGRVDKAGINFVGEPIDVTSDVLKAVCEKFADKGPLDVTAGGVAAYEITVRTLAPRPTQKYCDECDGCGWYEGGTAIQTVCKKCNGAGVVPNSAIAPSQLQRDQQMKESSNE